MMRLPKLPSLNALMPISIDERRRASAAYEQANPGYDASVFARLRPPQPDMSGVVFQGGQPNADTGYVAPQTIPGTARPTTPVVPGQSYGNDNIMQQEVTARTPWFSAPFQQQYQPDLPYWMRGMKGAR